MPSNNIDRQARRKRQARLTFDSGEPSSSAGLTPAKVRYEAPSSSAKMSFNTSSQIPIVDEDAFQPGKRFAVVIEPHAKRPKVDGKLPFLPVSSPVGKGSQKNTEKSEISLFLQSQRYSIHVIMKTNYRILTDTSRQSSRPTSQRTAILILYLFHDVGTVSLKENPRLLESICRRATVSPTLASSAQG